MTEEHKQHLAAHEIAKVFPPLGDGAMTLEEYRQEYARSIQDPGAYWSEEAKKRITWYHPFSQALSGDFIAGDISWFAGGKTNVCYNAIDRHVEAGKGDQVAMVWEGDEPDDIKRLTYIDLQRKISQITNALLASGVRKGDVVTI